MGVPAASVQGLYAGIICNGPSAGRALRQASCNFWEGNPCDAPVAVFVSLACSMTLSTSRFRVWGRQSVFSVIECGIGTLAMQFVTSLFLKSPG